MYSTGKFYRAKYFLVFFVFSIGGGIARRHLSAVCTLVTGAYLFNKATANTL